MGDLEAFFEAEYERTRGQALPADPEHLAAWVGKTLGTFEAARDQAPRVVETVPCDGYTRRKLLLSAVEGLTFEAYLLVPDGPGPFSGVLALHGHGYGPEEAVGLGPESGHHHFARSLVHKGLVVLVPGVIGFGARRFEVDARNPSPIANSCQKMASQLLLGGKTLAGLRVAEARGALAALRALPEVAARPVGLVGFSGGALIASWLALVERVDATVLVGFANTFRDSILAVPHCIDNYVPGVLAMTELPDLLARLAPQPLFLESGTGDTIFPPAGFLATVETVAAAYAQAGVAERFDSDLFPGVHEVSGRRSFPWLARTLGVQR